MDKKLLPYKDLCPWQDTPFQVKICIYYMYVYVGDMGAEQPADESGVVGGCGDIYVEQPANDSWVVGGCQSRPGRQTSTVFMK